MARDSIVLVAAVVACGLRGTSARADVPSGQDTKGPGKPAPSAIPSSPRDPDPLPACNKLETEAQLEPSAYRFATLATCQERAGLTASAWYSFAKTRDLAEVAGDTEQVRLAKANMQRIDGQLCKIAVVVPTEGELSWLVVRRDDSIITPPGRDLPVAVNPGQHVISATAPGRHPWSAEFGLTQCPATITINVPPLTDDHDRGSLANDVIPVAPRLPESDAHRGDTQRLVAWGLGGAGMTSVIVGAAFAFRASSLRSDMNSSCQIFDGERRCSAQGRDQLDRVRTAANTANALVLLGAASIIGGGIVYFTAPSARDAQPRARALQIAPFFGSTGAGIAAAGRF